MKKAILFLLLIVISFTGFSQNAMSKADSIEMQTPPDPSVNFISIQDLNNFMIWAKQNTSYSDFLKATPDEIMAALYKWAILNYNQKRKNKKP